MDNRRGEADRVFFVYNTAAYLIRFRSELIRELQDKGYECHAALPADISPAEHATLTGMGVTVHRLRHFVDQRITPLADVRLAFEYYNLYRRLKPKIVFNFTIKPCIYSSIAARLAGVRTVAAMITGLGYAFTGTNLKGRLISFLAGQAYKFALYDKATVFFQNTEDYSYFVEKGIVTPERSVHVNGSGVDVSIFRPAEARPGDAPVFLMVARLLRDKGVVEYLEACRAAKQKLPDARFMLVGPFDENPSGIGASVLQPYIDDGVIDYKGYLPDPLVAYHAASIYVLPSYSEGRPRTVLEAMACGLAIITTDARGCRETIEPAINGYLVPARSARALSEKMVELGSDPRRVRDMGVASRRIAKERYDVRHITAKICETVCGNASQALPRAEAGVTRSTAAAE